MLGVFFCLRRPPATGRFSCDGQVQLPSAMSQSNYDLHYLSGTYMNLLSAQLLAASYGQTPEYFTPPLGSSLCQSSIAAKRRLSYPVWETKRRLGMFIDGLQVVLSHHS